MGRRGRSRGAKGGWGRGKFFTHIHDLKMQSWPYLRLVTRTEGAHTDGGANCLCTLRQRNDVGGGQSQGGDAAIIFSQLFLYILQRQKSHSHFQWCRSSHSRQYHAKRRPTVEVTEIMKYLSILHHQNYRSHSKTTDHMLKLSIN